MYDDYENDITDTIMSESNRSDREKGVFLYSFRDPYGCPLYEMIREGKKTVEGRKNSPYYQKVKVGDIILLSERKKGILECEVTYVKLYSDVKEYLASEGLDNVFGVPSKCRSISNIIEGADLYHEFVKEGEISSLKSKYGHGFMGIGIRFLHEYKRHYEDLNSVWFDAIKSGKKIAEGRLNKSWVSTLQPLDMIEFKERTENGIDETEKPIRVMVSKIKKYKSFIELFDDVGLDKVLPGIDSYDNGIKVYRQWYSEEKEKEFGVVGIFFSKVD